MGDLEDWFNLEDIAKELLLESKELSVEKQNNRRKFLDAVRNLIMSLDTKEKSIHQP